QVAVGLDSQSNPQIAEQRGKRLEHLHGRTDLSDPGCVGAEAVVPIAHVNAGVTAAEGGCGPHVRAELFSPKGGLAPPAHLSPAPDWIRRWQADLDIQSHRVSLAPEFCQPVGIELSVDR